MTESNIYLNGEYFVGNPGYHTDDSPWKAKQILDMLARNPLPVDTACEVGCGAGEIIRLVQEAMPENVTFQGYEISPEAVELCKARENSRLSFVCEDILEADSSLLICCSVSTSLNTSRTICTSLGN